MNKLKVMSVFGTRPEAIKMAPLVKALQASEQIESIVCLTGQHREMLDSVMEIFQLTGDYDLHIMEAPDALHHHHKDASRHGQRSGYRQTRSCPRPRRYVHDIRRRACRVLPSGQGRPRRGRPAYLGQILPFPEEMNRTLVGDIADLHFPRQRPTRIISAVRPSWAISSSPATRPSTPCSTP